MTARPGAPKADAPTLDDDLASFAASDAAQTPVGRRILASLERLRGIEQAAGMPEEPEDWGTTSWMLHSKKLTAHCLHLADRLARESENLRVRESLYKEEWQRANAAESKLARMEALLREPTQEMCEVGGNEFMEARHRKSTTEQMDAKFIFRAMTAALLAKLEKEKV